MMTLALLGVMGWSLEDAMQLIQGRRHAVDFADVYVQSVERFMKKYEKNNGAPAPERKSTQRNHSEVAKSRTSDRSPAPCRASLF